MYFVVPAIAPKFPGLRSHVILSVQERGGTAEAFYRISSNKHEFFKAIFQGLNRNRTCI